MKHLLPLLVGIITLTTAAQTPCSNGTAGQFPCNGFDLQSFISLNDMNASQGNDSWGWTDSETGKEYAIMGLNNGTAFIDISNPINPIYLGKLPTNTDSSTWRDIKVYNNHAFVVSEASGHGMQIFDLTRLRNVSNPPQNFNEDALYDEFGNCHNIVINEDTGFAYAVGTQTFSGGPHIINIQNPTNPTFAGGFSFDNYSHDAQVVVYNGPDQDYVGEEIYFGSHGQGGQGNDGDIVSIVNVTNKNDIQSIATASYENLGYTHQGWLTEDHRYFIVGDETDEIGIGFNTKTIVLDVSDLDNPFVSFEYNGPTAAIDHNGYVKGDDFYLSNYSAGLRVLDISNIDNGVMTERAYFDTSPENNTANFVGAWSVYPYFTSGNIVISDINRGFFLVRDPSLGTQNFSQNDFEISPNPAKNNFTITATNEPLKSLEVFNVLGQRIMNLTFSATTLKNINIETLNSGMYLLKINGDTTKRLIVN
jgi:choice-of-anchor B domain-containing protein